MNNNIDNVKQAKDSFGRVLDNKIYAEIIKDDEHLSLLLGLIKGGNFSKILDIGTGTGYLAFPLAELFSDAMVWGIDIVENIVEKNNETVREKGIPNLVFKAFDGLKYPFPNESFGLIVTRYAFHHFPNVIDAIQQMNKLLAKGGKVLVSDPMRNEEDCDGIIDRFMKVKKDGHIKFYSSQELNKLFSDNGFTKEKQVVSSMRFPFPPNAEYIDIYNKVAEGDRQLYGITCDDGTVKVNHIDVGNTIFVKQ